MSDELRPCKICAEAPGFCSEHQMSETDDLRAKLAIATAALEAMRLTAFNDELNPALLSVESIARHALAKIKEGANE